LERSAPVKLCLSSEQSERITVALSVYFPALFRTARRLGLSANLAEEAVQEAMIVFTQRIAQIAKGAERAYLFGCVARIAANVRRSAHARHEVAFDPISVEFTCVAPTAATLLEQKQARVLLDQVLSKFTPELREVFVLYEIEQLTMSEIAEALGVKPGTVSSRLHRARQEFDATMQRLTKPTYRARGNHEGA
jgi:RNA polymerase sigma-70 factor (ECF subfamily)